MAFLPGLKKQLNKANQVSYQSIHHLPSIMSPRPEAIPISNLIIIETKSARSS
jgi:hypothetical protein